MAVITLSDLINDIRGKVGGKVYSIWKGIHTVKSQPINFQYAWGSAFNSAVRALIKTLSYRWAFVLTDNQKNEWETYAQYLGTLPTDYDRLVGWKQYGGAMSGFNAYSHCNLMRLSVGLTGIQDDAPNAEISPGQPGFDSFTQEAGLPITLTAAYTLPGILPLPSYIRAWCRGTKYAHLIIAKYADVEQGGGEDWTVAYEANEVPTLATPPWEIDGVELGVIEDGILHVVSDGVSRCNYIRTIANPQAGICLRFRARVAGMAGFDNWQSIRVQSDPANGWWVYTSIENNRWVININGIDVHIEALDGTVFHEYQMSKDGNDWYFKVDGNLVHTEVAPGTMGLLLSQIEFGNVFFNPAQHSYWDWVRYYLGAPEPAVIDELSWNKMRYAKGANLNIIPDVYQTQLDIVSDKGRFSPPSEIRTLRVT